MSPKDCPLLLVPKQAGRPQGALLDMVSRGQGKGWGVTRHLHGNRCSQTTGCSPKPEGAPASHAFTRNLPQDLPANPKLHHLPLCDRGMSPSLSVPFS